MYVKSLNLVNFRNYINLNSTFNKNTNILVGNNGQGKTSVLESLYILGLTKSHKVNNERDVIKIDTDYAKINAVINLKEKDVELSVIVSKLGKKAKYNQIELERLSDYVGILNIVMFSPEDIELIKGNPQNRRKFLDLEIGQISKEYLYNLQNYRKVLKQRNDLLKTLQTKKDNDLMLLDIITDQLIGYMNAIYKQRSEFVSQISSLANEIYKRMSNSNEELQIKYIPSIEKNAKEEFSAKYQYDIITGTTNLGSHRDDVEFYLDKNHLKTHGSQGEMRTAVLSVKLALVDFIFNNKKEYPVLLLDDVLSELDINRQNNLLEYIQNKTQTFITTTEISDINLQKITNYKIYTVDRGHMKERGEDE
jgi:DNA replication and repair protein RecF